MNRHGTDAMTTPEKNLHAAVPPALLARAQEAAQQEHITLDELVSEAMERRLRERRRQKPSGEAQPGKRWSRGKGKIDWSECPLVEIDPEIQSRAPVLRGTRMLVDAIVDNADYGESAAEIAGLFEIPLERVEAVLTYVKSHRVAHPVR